MIELTQIKTTDQLGQLRGQLNTAFTEIQTDQPFIGRVINPSVNVYASGGTLAAAITASELTQYYLYALCFPESNGVFVAKVFGQFAAHIDMSTELEKLVIDVPSVKLPTRDATIGTFVNPSTLGLATSNLMHVGTGLLNNHPVTVDIAQSDTSCDVTVYPTPDELVIPTGDFDTTITLA